MSDTSPRNERVELISAHAALIGAQLAFGLFPIFGQVIFRPGGLSPLGVGAWRLAGGGIILSTLAVIAYRRGAFIRMPDLPRFVAASWLGVALNQALYLEGLARSTPMNATLVMCLIPVFTFLLAAAARQETFSAGRLFGVLIALSGLLPLLVERGVSGLGRYGFGNLLMVTNSLSYASYLVVSKSLMKRYPPLVVIAWCYVLSVPFVPTLAWGQPLMPQPGHVSARWALAYIVVFPTTLAYLFNGYALARVQASTTAIYIYSQPLITGLASWVVLGELPTGQMALAAAALFMGIWLVSRRPRELVSSAA